MAKLLTKDNYQAAIGTELGVSDWLEVTQEDVNTFADVTRDHQFIHVDPKAAAKTPFGGPIAHGFFTLSMITHFAETGASFQLEGTKMGVNYGCNKVRFLSPVRVGSRIRGKATLVAAEEKAPGQYLFTTSMEVEIEGVEKPALIAEWLGMMFTDPS